MKNKKILLTHEEKKELLNKNYPPAERAAGVGDFNISGVKSISEEILLTIANEPISDHLEVNDERIEKRGDVYFKKIKDLIVSLQGMDKISVNMSAFDRNVTYRYLLKAIQDLILLVADTRRILEVELERNVSTHEKGINLEKLYKRVHHLEINRNELQASVLEYLNSKDHNTL